MGWLTGLGSLAGGLSQGLYSGAQLQYMQQDKQASNALGQSLASLSGVPYQQGQGQGGGLGGILGGAGNSIASLFQGGQQASQGQQQPQGQQSAIPQQQQVPQQAFQQQAPPATGMGQSPMPSQQGPQVATPRVAQPNTPLGGGQQTGGPAQQPQPQQQAQPQQRPQAQQPQPQQQMGGGAQQGMGGGPMTLQQVVQGIRRANPNANPAVLARAVQQAVPLLNAGGLQQYRQMQGMFQQERIDQGYDRLGQQSEQFSRRQGEREKEFGMRETRLEGKEKATGAYRTQLQELAVARDKIKSAYDSAKAAAMNPALDPAEQKKQLEAARDARNKADDELDAKIKAMKEPAAEPEQAGGHEPGATRVISGKTWRFKGGDWDTQASWEPVEGGQ